ncbi:MAG: (Fe-S)-binding protein [Candidatus Helarchaeota archaeon]
MTEIEYPHLEKVRDMLEACYRCGDCRIAYRPAVGRYMVCPVRETIPGKWEPFFARGKIMLANGLLQGHIKPSQRLAEIVFQCMICGSCQTICNQSYHPSINHPLSLIMDHPKIWESFRAELIDRGYSIKRHDEILKSCEDNHNPYFEKHEDRTKWVPNDKKFPKEAEYVLFMGCTEPYRNPDILQKMVKVLDFLGINYTILGDDEWCCGSVALRTGNKKFATELATHNYNAIKKAKGKKIITHCAGCYRTLKKDYPEILPEFDLEVFHITEIIQKFIDDNKFQIKDKIEMNVTYHDPCHLGRHMKIYDQPRNIINYLGANLIEMKRIKENSWCCGAGGGVKSGFPELANKIARSRIEEALETGTDALITACPFCINNLREASNNEKTDKNIKVLDILDLIVEVI